MAFPAARLDLHPSALAGWLVYAVHSSRCVRVERPGGIHPSWPSPLPGRRVRATRGPKPPQLAPTCPPGPPHPKRVDEILRSWTGARSSRSDWSRIGLLSWGSSQRCPSVDIQRVRPLPAHSVPSTSTGEVRRVPGDPEGLRPSDRPGVAADLRPRVATPGTRSALAVSHDFGGLLRTRGAGLLHPAANHGVRLVSGHPPVLPPRHPTGARSPCGGRVRADGARPGAARSEDPAVGVDVPGADEPKLGARGTGDRGCTPSLEKREVDLLGPVTERGACGARCGPKPQNALASRWPPLVALLSRSPWPALRSPRCPQAPLPGTGRRMPGSGSEDRSQASTTDGAEATASSLPTFEVHSAKALLLEAGAVRRSFHPPAPFPQARSPFEAFPSFTAVPRHRGQLPSRRFWRPTHRRHPLSPAGTSDDPSPRVPRALLHERVRCCFPACAGSLPDAPLGFLLVHASSKLILCTPGRRSEDR